MNLRLFRPSAIPAIAFAVFFVASSLSYASERWSGTCRVEFSGSSTFGSWSGAVDTEPFSAVVEQPDRLEVSPVATVINAQTDKLTTNNERRDKAMKQSMKASIHPLISVRLAPDFTMARTRPEKKSGVLQPTVVPFIVELLGKEYEMTGRVSHYEVEDGSMRLKVEFPVSLKSCGVKTPTVLGIIRVGDVVDISAAITLQMSTAVAGR